MFEYVFFLDLIDNQDSIAKYDDWHKKVWPEVEEQIINAGIRSCDIYRYINRLVLIVRSENEMDWERKAESDSQHQPTKEWEQLMWNFQQSMPGSLPGQKWMMAQKIYHLQKV